MVDIDPDRLRAAFDDYSAIGATDNDGLHRLTLSPEDERVRDAFVSDLEDLDLSIRVDPVGNVFGRREGTTPSAAPVLIGSHLDSQPYGGHYDGQLGVLAALETLRALDDHGVETTRPIEIVNWTNEEGSRFKPALMGSGVYAGAHDLDTVLETTDDKGTTVAEALDEIGYRGDEPVGPTERPDSFLELHVEQGPFLEEHSNAVGIVDGIYGMAWLEATIIGESDHAGPTPMHTRSDALVAAADAITAVRRLSTRLGDDVVTTVGELSVEPDSVNVIPSEVTFTVDLRSYDNATVDKGIKAVDAELAAACEREGVDYSLEKLWQIPHTEFSPRVRDRIEGAARETGRSFERMVGGAGHDASYVNDVTDAGMIFVPSVDGKTHTEAEFTEWEDVVAGVEVFANATQRLAECED